MAVKLNWTRLRSVEVSPLRRNCRAGSNRPVSVDVQPHKALMCLGLPPTPVGSALRVCCRGRRRQTLYRQLNRYRIKRISNLEYDRSCSYTSFAGPARRLGPCSTRRRNSIVQLDRPASSRCIDERQNGRTAAANSICEINSTDAGWNMRGGQAAPALALVLDRHRQKATRRST